VDQFKTHPTNGNKFLFLDPLEDTLTLIQILLMSNQELSGIKSSPRLREKLLLEIFLDHSAPSPIDPSKKDSSLTSTRSTQTMETDLPRLSMFQLTKLDYEIF
jgi:hypothetical protein